jgi:hypothetical protein
LNNPHYLILLCASGDTPIVFRQPESKSQLLDYWKHHLPP